MAPREANLTTFRGEHCSRCGWRCAAQAFLSGEAPADADYIVSGAFMWARAVSPFRLLEADEPVHAWRGRMLGLFDGLQAAPRATKSEPQG